MAELYRFQNLDVYKLALQYLDVIYGLAAALPGSERFNLADQMTRAATSIVLNIAEGSTGQSDAEQRRFLGLALRSYLETVACLDIAGRRAFIEDEKLAAVRRRGHDLFVKDPGLPAGLRWAQDARRMTGDG